MKSVKGVPKYEDKVYQNKKYKDNGLKTEIECRRRDVEHIIKKFIRKQNIDRHRHL